MATQQLLIDGVDFTDCVTADGLKWSRNDIDAPGSGRDKSGTMRRARVATKAKLQVSLRTLEHARMVQLNQAIFPQTVQVTYLDPRQGTRTATFYGSTIDAATSISQNGKTLWSGGTFNLIEV